MFFVLQLQLDVGRDDYGVEVGGDEDEEDGRKLFPLQHGELDGTENEESDDG